MHKLALSAGLLGLLLGACSADDSATDSGAQALRLNEVLAKSETGSDWLELYNTSDAEVSLVGLGLRDSKADWTFEEGTIAAKGFVRVFCDDSGGAGRTNFKLSSDGEALTLVDSGGATLDAVTYPSLKSDVSWGRYPDGTGSWSYLEQPTPAGANARGGSSDGGVDARASDAGAPTRLASRALTASARSVTSTYASRPTKTRPAAPAWATGAALAWSASTRSAPRAAARRAPPASRPRSAPQVPASQAPAAAGRLRTQACRIRAEL